MTKRITPEQYAGMLVCLHERPNCPKRKAKKQSKKQTQTKAQQLVDKAKERVAKERLARLKRRLANIVEEIAFKGSYSNELYSNHPEYKLDKKWVSDLENIGFYVKFVSATCNGRTVTEYTITLPPVLEPKPCRGY